MELIDVTVFVMSSLKYLILRLSVVKITNPRNEAPDDSIIFSICTCCANGESGLNWLKTKILIFKSVDSFPNLWKNFPLKWINVFVWEVLEKIKNSRFQSLFCFVGLKNLSLKIELIACKNICGSMLLFICGEGQNII